MSTGETPEEIFAANVVARISCHLHVFYIHHVFDKIPTWKLFTLTIMEKSKTQKSPWVKKKKKTSQKRKKSLAESNKGSWFGQRPSTTSASAEDRGQAKLLGASSLKIKVNASACCEQDSSSEWVIPEKNPHPTDGWVVFKPPSYHLDFLKPKSPPPVWISRKKKLGLNLI